MKMMTRALFVAAALAIAALGVTSWMQGSELKANTAVIDKQAVQLLNKQLEVDGLASEVAALNGQAEALVADADLVASLNAQQEKQTQLLQDERRDWLTNSNQLQVSTDETTRTWASAALPPDALRLLHSASRSQNGDRNEDGDSFTAGQLSQLGLRTATL